MSTPFKIITNQGQVFPSSNMIYLFGNTGYVPQYAKECKEDIEWVNAQTSLNFNADEKRKLKVFPYITDWSSYNNDALSFAEQSDCAFHPDQVFTLKNGIAPAAFRHVHGITDLVFGDPDTPTGPINIDSICYELPNIETISGFYEADGKQLKGVTICCAARAFGECFNLTGQEDFYLSFSGSNGDLVDGYNLFIYNSHATGLPTLVGTQNVKQWDNAFNGYGYDVATTGTVGSYGNLEITLVDRSQIQDPDGGVANIHKMIHNALMIGSLTINGSGGPAPTYDDNGRWCPLYWPEVDLDNELVVAWLNQLKIYVDSSLLSEYISRNKSMCEGDPTKEDYVDSIFSAIS